MKGMILERFTSVGKLLETDKKKLPDGVLCRAKYQICSIGERNRNNRVYENAVWERVLADKDILEKLKNRSLFFHAEHPSTTQSNTEKVAGIVTEITTEGNKAFAVMEVLDTPYGRIVDTLLRAGCGIGVSTRADGELEEAADDKGTYSRVVPESYKFVTVDFTADPSSYGSELPIEVKRNVAEVVKVGIDNEKIDREYATVLLERLDVPEARTILESMKADKHHKNCKLKTSEKRCTKGCPRANESDFGNSVVVYDNGGKTADRYTVVIDNEYVFGMSDNARQPNGFNQFAGTVGELKLDNNPSLGKKVDVKTLPKEVQDAIKDRISSNESRIKEKSLRNWKVGQHVFVAGDTSVGMPGWEGTIVSVSKDAAVVKDIKDGEEEEVGLGQLADYEEEIRAVDPEDIKEALPGEIHGGKDEITCEDCGAKLPLKVLQSGAGYYYGYWCPQCGPYARESGYFGSKEEAQAAMHMKADLRDTKYHGNESKVREFREQKRDADDRLEYFKCDCGEWLYTDRVHDVFCEKCHRDYNAYGQLLAPKEQWGEETGEHWSEYYMGQNEAVLKEGTEIWYSKPETFRDLIVGSFGKGYLNIDPKNLNKTHIKLTTIPATDPEDVFSKMQGENWSPRGEARELITSKGLNHTSMSVGDVMVVNGKALMVDNMGFINLATRQNESKEPHKKIREHKVSVTTPDLASVDIESLDPIERRWFDDWSKRMSKEEALQVIINTTEGDWTQLSPELKVRAEKDPTWKEIIGESKIKEGADPKNYVIIRTKYEDGHVGYTWISKRDAGNIGSYGKEAMIRTFGPDFEKYAVDKSPEETNDVVDAAQQTSSHSSRAEESTSAFRNGSNIKLLKDIHVKSDAKEFIPKGTVGKVLPLHKSFTDYNLVGAEFKDSKGNIVKINVNTEDIESTEESKIKEVIKKVGGKWQVQSHKGKNLGTYTSKAAAHKRLGQVEYFKKHKNEAAGIYCPKCNEPAEEEGYLCKACTLAKGKGTSISGDESSVSYVDEKKVTESSYPADYFKTKDAAQKAGEVGIEDMENSDLTAKGLIAKMKAWDESEHGVPKGIYDATAKQLKSMGAEMPKSIRRIAEMKDIPSYLKAVGVEDVYFDKGDAQYMPVIGGEPKFGDEVSPEVFDAMTRYNADMGVMNESIKEAVDAHIVFKKVDGEFKWCIVTSHYLWANDNGVMYSFPYRYQAEEKLQQLNADNKNNEARFRGHLCPKCGLSMRYDNDDEGTPTFKCNHCGYEMTREVEEKKMLGQGTTSADITGQPANLAAAKKVMQKSAARHKATESKIKESQELPYEFLNHLEDPEAISPDGGHTKIKDIAYDGEGEIWVARDGTPDIVISYDSKAVAREYLDKDAAVTDAMWADFNDEDDNSELGYHGGGWIEWMKKWLTAKGYNVSPDYGFGADNTYNWDNAYWWGDVFEYVSFHDEANNRDGIAIMWHQGGDVRGNYSMPEVYFGDVETFISVQNVEYKDEIAYILGYEGDYKAFLADWEAWRTMGELDDMEQVELIKMIMAKTGSYSEEELSNMSQSELADIYRKAATWKESPSQMKMDFKESKKMPALQRNIMERKRLNEESDPSEYADKVYKFMSQHTGKFDPEWWKKAVSAIGVPMTLWGKVKMLVQRSYDKTNAENSSYPKESKMKEDVQMVMEPANSKITQFLNSNWELFLGEDDAINNLVKVFKISPADAKKYVEKASQGKGTLSAAYAFEAKIKALEAEKSRINDNYGRDSIAFSKKINALKADLASLTEANAKVAEANAKLEGSLKEKTDALEEANKALGKTKKLLEDSKASITQLKESHKKALVKTYTETKIKCIGLKVPTRYLTLLESCNTTEEVDAEIRRFQNAVTESALQFSGSTEIRVTETARPLDPKQVEIDNKVEKAMSAWTGSKTKQN